MGITGIERDFSALYFPVAELGEIHYWVERTDSCFRRQ